MKTKKTLRESVGEILEAMNDGYKILGKEGLELAVEDNIDLFLNLFSQFGDELIGKNEYQGDDTPKIRTGDLDAGVRNQLRKEQRKRKEELLKEGG